MSEGFIRWGMAGVILVVIVIFSIQQQNRWKKRK